MAQPGAAYVCIYEELTYGYWYIGVEVGKRMLA
jgi:hypothetical protein